MGLVAPGNDPGLLLQLLDMASRVGKVAIDTAVKSGAFPIAKSAIVAAGNLVVHLTDDGLPGGNALFPGGNVYLDTLMLRGDNEVDSPLSYGQPVLSNSNKTLTVPVKKSTGIVVALLSLTPLGAPAPANGSVVKAIVFGN